MHLAAKPVFLPRNIRQWRRLNKQREESSPPSDEPRREAHKDDAEDDDDEDKKAEKQLLSDLDMMDDTECKFNVNSFKMVYVVNSESYLYKRMALRRAQQSHKTVSLRLHSRFSAWHDHWLQSHMTKDDRSAIDDWLLGKVSGLKECRTVCKTNNDLTKAPYYTYNQNKVDYSA